MTNLSYFPGPAYSDVVDDWTNNFKSNTLDIHTGMIKIGLGKYSDLVRLNDRDRMNYEQDLLDRMSINRSLQYTLGIGSVDSDDTYLNTVIPQTSDDPGLDSVRDESNSIISGVRDESRQQLSNIRDESRQQLSNIQYESRQQLSNIRDESRQQLSNIQYESRQQLSNIQYEDEDSSDRKMIFKGLDLSPSKIDDGMYEFMTSLKSRIYDRLNNIFICSISYSVETIQSFGDEVVNSVILYLILDFMDNTQSSPSINEQILSSPIFSEINRMIFDEMLRPNRTIILHLDKNFSRIIRTSDEKVVDEYYLGSAYSPNQDEDEIKYKLNQDKDEIKYKLSNLNPRIAGSSLSRTSGMNIGGIVRSLEDIQIVIKSKLFSRMMDDELPDYAITMDESSEYLEFSTYLQGPDYDSEYDALVYEMASILSNSFSILDNISKYNLPNPHEINIARALLNLRLLPENNVLPDVGFLSEHDLSSSKDEIFKSLDEDETIRTENDNELNSISSEFGDYRNVGEMKYPSDTDYYPDEQEESEEEYE